MKIIKTLLLLQVLLSCTHLVGQTTEGHIQKEGYLPEMPKAAEVAEKGMNVAEMNNLLLKKVEELTLYIIEMKKEVELLKKQ